MAAENIYKLFANPKDQILILPKDQYEMSWKVPKNALTSLIKNRIDSASYSKNALLALQQADSRFVSLSEGFIKDVVLPALSSEIMSLNLANKSKTEAIFPTYAHFLKGVNFFYQAQKNKFSFLNKAESFLMEEVLFFKTSFNELNKKSA